MIPEIPPEKASSFLKAFLINVSILIIFTAATAIAEEPQTEKPPKWVRLDRIRAENFRTPSHAEQTQEASRQDGKNFTNVHVDGTTKQSKQRDPENYLTIQEEGIARYLKPRRLDESDINNYPRPVSSPKLKVLAAAESPDLKWMAIYYYLREYPKEYDKIHIYEKATKRLVKVIDASVQSTIKFSPNSDLLVFVSEYDIGTINQRPIAEVWEVGNEEKPWKRIMSIDPPAHYKGISSLAISPDNRVVAIAGNRRFGLYPIDPNQNSPDVPQRIPPIPGSEGSHFDPSFKAKSILNYEISDIFFDPDGVHLITFGEDGMKVFWQAFDEYGKPVIWKTDRKAPIKP